MVFKRSPVLDNLLVDSLAFFPLLKRQCILFKTHCSLLVRLLAVAQEHFIYAIDQLSICLLVTASVEIFFPHLNMFEVGLGEGPVERGH